MTARSWTATGGTVSRGAGGTRASGSIRRDPRDRRNVFFQDPVTHALAHAALDGLPPSGQVPAFGDARAATCCGRQRRRAAARDRTPSCCRSCWS